MLTCGSLFSGIGGIDLGFERAGIKTVWQVEIDGFAQLVLRKRFTGRLERDIRKVSFAELEKVDIIAGGFPCNDTSHAGRGAGIAGEYSGLWTYFPAAIRALRPRFVVVENPPGLLSRGMGRVQADLALCGYDAEWDCLPAAAFGSPQLRAREWILAYPCGYRKPEDGTIFAGRTKPDVCAWWDAEPDMARMVDGPTERMDRLRINAMGRMAVPQIAEWIGRRIIASFGETPHHQASQGAGTPEPLTSKKGLVEDAGGQAIAEFALMLPVFVLVAFMLVDLQWLAKDAANIDYIANETARCEAIGSPICASASSTINYAKQQAANLRLTAANFHVTDPDCTGMTQCSISITYQYKPLGVYFPAITIARTGTAVRTPGP